ncbi:TetR/AcrR family transcriptional regulator [Microbacterium sp.]|uniref:TetR/AcrR family transcriptional regulator n=1 Tax=Microbacterium sp. TaxID=51671 RepID=UPI003A8F153F
MPSSAGATLPVQQRAWETRERILTAAVQCLAEEGYAATTTSRIQARSGVSRGSLLHQFPSRDDLLIAAVQHLGVQRATDYDAAQAGGSPADADRAVDALWATFTGPLFSAALQLWTAAQHNPDLAASLVPHERELGRRIRVSAAAMFGERNAAHPRFSELLSLLVSSMRGVALTYTFDPRDAATDPHLAAWRRLAHDILDDVATESAASSD